MSDRIDHLPHDVLLPLLAALRPVPFEATRRSTLRAHVLARATPAPAGRAVRADEGRWQTLQPGLSVKVLRRDRTAGDLTALWRLDPGGTIPAHTHSMDEECVVLEGDVSLDGVEYGVGDYLLAARGTAHPEFRSRGGCVLMIRGQDPFADIAHA